MTAQLRPIATRSSRSNPKLQICESLFRASRVETDEQPVREMNPPEESSSGLDLELEENPDGGSVTVLQFPRPTNRGQRAPQSNPISTFSPIRVDPVD